MSESGDAIKKIAREADEWAARQKSLQLSEISVVIRSYDDIFSDFDPRTFDKRALSDDFLSEIKRASVEKKNGVIDLTFLTPLEIKKPDLEIIIKKRLRDHFKKHYEQLEKEIFLRKKNGGMLVFGGVALSVIAVIFFRPLEGVPQDLFQLLKGILFLLAEPAAWFTIWTGFDWMFTSWKVLENDHDFYKKMSKSEINFTSY
ncbi:MAG: hypothetical protein WCW13_00495 [archaeon]|jgi:hypothetical protein